MKQIFTLALLAASFLANSTPLAAKPVKHTQDPAMADAKPSERICTSQGCQVAFEHKGQYITAVYNTTGKLRFYKKHILSTQLPVTLQLKLKNQLKGYWISDVQEKSGNSGATYLLTLENGYKKITLNATGGSWQIDKITNKA